MVLEQKDLKQLDKLSKIIGSYFNIQVDNYLITLSRRGMGKKASKYFMFFAHYYLNFSSQKIAIYCNKSRRYVFRGMAIIRHFSSLYEDDKIELNNLLEYIKKEDSDLLSSSNE